MITRILSFYCDGFRNMQLGKTLWKLILIKLVVMFAILKWLFFPDVLQQAYDNDAARADHVLQRLSQAETHGG